MATIDHHQLPERPLLTFHFRDGRGQLHTATLSSSCTPASDVDLQHAAWAAGTALFEAGMGLTVTRIERVRTPFTLEVEAS